MGSRNADGNERRFDLRVTYPASRRAALVTARLRFDLVDISQGGFRMVDEADRCSAAGIAGDLELLCGITLAVEARREWAQDGQIGFSLKYLLDSDVLEREKRFVILHYE